MKVKKEEEEFVEDAKELEASALACTCKQNVLSFFRHFLSRISCYKISFGWFLLRLFLQKEDSQLLRHARFEMKLADLYDKDADYDGMIPKAVEDLLIVHASQGHSGGSHWLVMDLFTKLANFKALMPITDNPEEWCDVAGFCTKSKKGMWQNKRQFNLFSQDGGKTYYSIDDEKRKKIKSVKYIKTK